MLVGHGAVSVMSCVPGGAGRGATTWALRQFILEFEMDILSYYID